jgi:hypothetical protein
MSAPTSLRAADLAAWLLRWQWTDSASACGMCAASAREEPHTRCVCVPDSSNVTGRPRHREMRSSCIPAAELRRPSTYTPPSWLIISARQEYSARFAGFSHDHHHAWDIGTPAGRTSIYLSISTVLHSLWSVHLFVILPIDANPEMYVIIHPFAGAPS